LSICLFSRLLKALRTDFDGIFEGVGRDPILFLDFGGDPHHDLDP